MNFTSVQGPKKGDCPQIAMPLLPYTEGLGNLNLPVQFTAGQLQQIFLVVLWSRHHHPNTSVFLVPLLQKARIPDVSER